MKEWIDRHIEGHYGGDVYGSPNDTESNEGEQMKYDHHNCTECGVEYHIDHDWKRNNLDMLVCDNCADNLPTFDIGRRNESPRFFGFCNKRVTTGQQSIDTEWFETEAEAKKAVIEMAKKLWGNTVNPIEEGAV